MSLRNVELQTLAIHIGNPQYHFETGINVPLPKAGVLTNPGISIFGDAVNGEKGTVTIYPPHSDSKQPSIPSLFIKGDTKQEGDTKQDGNISATGEVSANNGIDRLTNKKNKPFDMPHPSKKGWRLRYVCIEGPEIGVYCRGRVENKNVIELPSYWKDLVNIDSLSVQLTPIGSLQNIFIEKWDETFVYLKNKDDLPINCFYHIIAQRKDDDLIVEYEGETYEDYPGGNEGYSFNWESSNIERLIKEATHEKLKEMKDSLK